MKDWEKRIWQHERQAKRKDIKEIMKEREKEKKISFIANTKGRRPRKNWVVKPDMPPEEASVKLSGFKFRKHLWPTQNKYIRKTKKEQYIMKCIEKWGERVKLGNKKILKERGKTFVKKEKDRSEYKQKEKKKQNWKKKMD